MTDKRSLDQLRIEESGGDFRHLMPLLLIGDESEAMISRYLPQGRIYVGMLDERVVAVCVVTIESDHCVEVKNLAVEPEMQRRGFGRAMLSYVESCFPGHVIMLGTGETPSTLRFYEMCGFRYSHRIKDFFTDNYDHPIIEEGVQLRDMLYLSKHSAPQTP